MLSVYGVCRYTENSEMTPLSFHNFCQHFMHFSVSRTLLLCIGLSANIL